jgi:hypothetical protein
MFGGWGIKIAFYQQTILQVIDIKQNYFSFAENLSARRPSFAATCPKDAEMTLGAA